MRRPPAGINPFSAWENGNGRQFDRGSYSSHLSTMHDQDFLALRLAFFSPLTVLAFPFPIIPATSRFFMPRIS